MATLSKALIAGGATVEVATLDYPGAPSHENLDGVEIHRLRGFTRHLRRFASDEGHYFHPTVPDPQLVRALGLLARRFRPDVIHAHGWILESCVAMTRGPDTALVATLHEYGAACVKQTFTQTATGCSTGPSLKRCIACARPTYGLAKSALLTTGLRSMWPQHRKVDRWLAISSAVRDANRIALRAEDERIDVVPTFVPDDIGLEARTPSVLDLPQGPFMLFVGAMGPHKGLQVLLDAMDRMSTPVPLVVLGTPRADAPDLARPNVHVHENVPHSQVMAAWAAAAVGVVPSVWPEPLGQVAVECLAAGTPAIVSATGGLGEVVRDDVEGLHVPPGDTVALAEALDRLLNDAALRGRLGAAGPSRARQFEISRVLPRVLESFDRALEHRRGSPARPASASA